MTSAPAWHNCTYCHAIAFGVEPVHGMGVPCPMKVLESEAYMEMLAAQTTSYTGTAFMSADMGAMLRKLTGEEE